MSKPWGKSKEEDLELETVPVKEEIPPVTKPPASSSHELCIALVNKYLAMTSSGSKIGYDEMRAMLAEMLGVK